MDASITYSLPSHFPYVQRNKCIEKPSRRQYQIKFRVLSMVTLSRQIL